MMVLTACSGKLLHNSAADNSANDVLCGTAHISFNDAENWQCLDNSHFLCSKQDGCLKDGVIYPLWSYFGDNSNSFDSVIPSQPEHPQGYQLEYKDDDYLWTCTEDNCVCGRGMIEKGNACEKDTFHAQVNQDCGQEVCKIEKNGICKDGKCWCGDTWQGPDGDKYDCREYSRGDEYYGGDGYSIGEKLSGAECTYYPGSCETTIEAFNKINDKKYAVYDQCVDHSLELRALSFEL